MGGVGAALEAPAKGPRPGAAEQKLGGRDPARLTTPSALETDLALQPQ